MDLETILTLGKMGYTKAEIMALAGADKPGEDPKPAGDSKPAGDPAGAPAGDPKPAAPAPDPTSTALLGAINALTAAVQAGNIMGATSGGSPAGQQTSAEDLLKLAGAGLLGKEIK